MQQPRPSGRRPWQSDASLLPLTAPSEAEKFADSRPERFFLFLGFFVECGATGSFAFGAEMILSVRQDRADLLDDGRVGRKHPAHGRFAHDEDGHLGSGTDRGGAKFPGEQRHLSEELAFLQGRDLRLLVICLQQDLSLPRGDNEELIARIPLPYDRLLGKIGSGVDRAGQVVEGFWAQGSEKVELLELFVDCGDALFMDKLSVELRGGVDDALRVGDLDAVPLEGIPNVRSNLALDLGAFAEIANPELQPILDAGVLEALGIADRSRRSMHALDCPSRFDQKSP